MPLLGAWAIPAGHTPSKHLSTGHLSSMHLSAEHLSIEHIPAEHKLWPGRKTSNPYEDSYRIIQRYLWKLVSLLLQSSLKKKRLRKV
jgi:hypothetical protein